MRVAPRRAAAPPTGQDRHTAVPALRAAVPRRIAARRVAVPAAGFWQRAAAPLLGLCLGLLALGPGLRRGFLLSYDMVFVPHEPLSAALPGLAPPRAVPSDLAVVIVSRVIPADIAQKFLLVSIFVLACSGMAALLESEPMLARLAAGVCYTWNPYVAERLIIGQWALLLGYAGLPWVLRALVTGGPHATRRLCLAMLPAIIGGFAAMAVTALLAVPVALLTRNVRTVTRTVAVLVAGSLPWLVPSFLHPVYADPAGVAAFAARPDTPFGSIGSLVMLGGIWNAQTVPAAYGGPWSALWLVITLGAATGYVLFAWRRPRREQRGGQRGEQHRERRGEPRGGSRWPGLGVAAVASLVIAAAGVTAAGREVLRAAIAVWPGIAVIRDSQQFVAPLALAEAVGFGLIVAWAQHPRRPAPNPAGPAELGKPADRADPAGRAIGVIALLTPLLLLPGLAWGAAGRLHPVWYPAGWLAAARAIDAAPEPGDVLLLPWAADRSPPWNGGEVMLDAWPRLLSRPVIWNDGTRVGNVWLSPDDPPARRLDTVLRETSGPLTAALRAAGVRFVVVDAGPRLAPRLPGAATIINQQGLVVYELPEAPGRTT